MSRINSSFTVFKVMMAIVVVVLLAGLLGVRLAGRSEANPPKHQAMAPQSATVPEPSMGMLQDLEIPCWACPEGRGWPVRFRTDLDLLAPLGTGGSNAGEWFVDFRKPDGPRIVEAREMMARRTEHHGGLGKILAADDPLLSESEPWCDQAVMRYYPDLLELDGWFTHIPNLLVPLTFAKSWVARGLDAEDPRFGLADCRRAIRLGRLLRQEDVVIITDLVGLACIRIGAQGIYDIARREGDVDLALKASVVLGECSAQRLLTSERITRSIDNSELRRDESGSVVLALADSRLETLVQMATGDRDRRFRNESILGLNIPQNLGTPAQRTRVQEVLEELTRSDDKVIAANARWSLEHVPTREHLEECMQEGPR